METVASRPLSDPVWNDLKDPAMGLNPADQQKVRDQISGNILKGQRQMANQEMDNLAT